jgi:flagellar FliL protein
MAKNDKQEEQEQQEPKKKKGKLKWILLAVIIIVLGAGGYFGYRYFMQGSQNNGNATQAEKKAEQEETGEPQMVSLPPFVVNLADPLGRRYLKVSLDVEVVNKKAAQNLEGVMPQVKDSLLLLLSSKSYSQVDSMEEKLQLKKEIVSRLNQNVDGSPVIKVYFTEFVVQ